MNYSKVLAISMMAVAIVMTACTKDKKDEGPGTLPDEIVTNIYEAATTKIEMKNPVTGEWITPRISNTRDSDSVAAKAYFFTIL